MRKKEEQSLRDLWDNNERSSIHVVRVPEERRKSVVQKTFQVWRKRETTDSKSLNPKQEKL